MNKCKNMLIHTQQQQSFCDTINFYNQQDNLITILLVIKEKQTLNYNSAYQSPKVSEYSHLVHILPKCCQPYLHHHHSLKET